jgi:hypothetical protein
MAQELPTWPGKKRLRYTGSILTGVTVQCGTGFAHAYSLNEFQLKEVLTRFSGREVKVGTHRTNPPDGSIGDWIRIQHKLGGFMSYLGPILIEEGFAQRGSQTDRIAFFTFSN